MVEPLVGDGRRVVGVLAAGASFLWDAPGGRSRVVLQLAPSLLALQWAVMPASPHRPRAAESGEVPIAALRRIHVEAAGGGGYALHITTAPAAPFPPTTLLAADALQAADWVAGLTLLHRLLA